MATLADIRRYFETGRHGRAMPLSELKDLSAEERDELTAALDALDGDVFDAEDAS